VKRIDVEELKGMRRRDDDLTVVNVLSADRYRKAHIPGSANVPADEEDVIPRVERIAGGKDQPVVVYCTNRECDASPNAGRRLEAADFQHVYHFAGGIQASRDAGESLASSG
jgi:rhodanese-related sulfurtransferase